MQALRAWPASCLGWALFIGVCGSPAAAQGIADEVRPEGIRLGALVLAPGVDLVPIGIDTNILRDPVDPKGDIVGGVMSQLTATVNMRPIDIETSTAVAYEHFAQYSDQRSVNRDHWIRVRTRLPRATLFASGESIDTRDRVNYDLDSRVRRMGTAAAVGGEFRITPKTSVTAGARRVDSEYAGDAIIDGIRLQETLQNRADKADASIRLRVTPLTTIFAEADQTRTRFTFSPERDSNSLRLVSGFETSSSLISGRFSAGYQGFQPLNNSFPSFSDVVGNADLTFPLGFATRLQLGVRRDLAYSYDPTDVLYVVGALQGSIVHRFGTRWQLEGSASRYQLAYRSLVTSDGEGAPTYSFSDGRVEHGHSVRGGIGFRVRRLVRIGAESEYLTRRSPQHDREYNGFRANVFLRFGFSTGRQPLSPTIYLHD